MQPDDTGHLLDPGKREGQRGKRQIDAVDDDEGDGFGRFGQRSVNRGHIRNQGEIVAEGLGQIAEFDAEEHIPIESDDARRLGFGWQVRVHSSYARMSQEMVAGRLEKAVTD